MPQRKRMQKPVRNAWMIFMSQKKNIPVSSKQSEVATLGGGCFWCTEAVFSLLEGVEKVEAGYSGGKMENPTYEEVSTGTTGHAEVVQISFNPNVISFKGILEVFFSSHDPATLNRQGNDVGTQYRSVIFYHDDQQKAIAEKVIKELTETKTWNMPIVTQIEPFKIFYNAEKYHQNYFKNHPEKSYCSIIIAPKIDKLKQHYLGKLKLHLP